MSLGIEVDLGPGHVVLDGDPAPRPFSKGALFALLWPPSPISATAELLLIMYNFVIGCLSFAVVVGVVYSPERTETAIARAHRFASITAILLVGDHRTRHTAWTLGLCTYRYFHFH